VFALLKLAVPMALLPSQSTLQETVELLKLSSVTCLFASEQLYPHAAAAAKEAGLPEEGIFILQGDVTGKVSLPHLIEVVKARGLPKIATRAVQDDTLAYLVFSSGTTGLPKGYFVHVNFATSFLKAEWIQRL
jgi:long-subunit acyl-CoA synthetase (AMP-forming)